MGIKITGLDELQRKFSDLERRASKMHGSHEIPMSELLSPSFLRGCSRFSSLDEMFVTSGFKVESQEDFSAIPDNEWDTFIRGNTSFGNWQKMLHAASVAWTQKELGL